RSTGSDRSAKAPACRSIASTNVVLPWSTWATIATFRRSVRTFRVVAVRAVGMRKAPWYRECWAPADSYGRLGHTTAYRLRNEVLRERPGTEAAISWSTDRSWRAGTG